MSFPALAWASELKVARASDKLVLLGLADRHNTESDRAYPSLAWLCEFSSLDRKTVVAALDRLEAAGHIADTGERVGKTKQIKSYLLNRNGSEKGTVKTEPFNENSPVIPTKQSQKRNTDTVLEPAEAKASLLKGDGLPDWVPVEPWLAFVRMRKAMRNVPFLDDAARGAIRKLGKLKGEGFDPEKLLWMAVDRGWRSFFPNDECKSTGSKAVLSATDWEARAAQLDRVGMPDAANECRMKARQAA